MKRILLRIFLLLAAAAVIILLYVKCSGAKKESIKKNSEAPVPAAGMYKKGNRASFILSDEIPGVKSKYSVFLLKTDLNGNQIWIQKYEAKNPRWAEAVFVSADDKISILGRQYDAESGESYPFVINCDDKGGLTGESEFGEDGIRLNLAGGGEIEAGLVKIPSQQDTGYYYEQIIFDKSLLQRYSGIKYFEWGNYGIIDPLGNIFELNGAETPGAEFHEMSVTRRDTKGSNMWNFTYGGEYFERAYSLCGVKNGGIIAAGVTESFGEGGSDAYLISVDALGNCRWVRSVGTAGDEAAYWIEKDGSNAVAAGVSCGINKTCDIMLLYIDDKGAVKWVRYFDTGTDEAAYFVTKINDGYLITGISGKF